jgi:predicted DNA-binding antitoxin AbrB/MazE fold protein
VLILSVSLHRGRIGLLDSKDRQMERTITAIFEDGVLKPVLPLELPPNTLVRITFEPCDDAAVTSDQSWQELEKCWDEIEVDSGAVRPTRDDLHDRT